MTALFGYSGAAFLAGMLLNVMPCVLPVIPFKIQAVMREIGGDIRSRMFAAAALLLGSLSFFLVLGGATAYMGLTWGALFQSKLFLAALSAFLFLAAIATLADWSIPLPRSVYKISSHRYSGAFLTGALAGILSTPCSGPFLGSVLAYALTRPPGVILTIFSAIGLGLAAPYVFILLWPGLIHRLLTGRIRFSGVWTVQVKQLFGFVLLAGAIFFARVFIAPSAHLVIWRVFFSAILIWALIMMIRARQWPARIFPIFPIAGSIALLMMTLPAGHLKWQPFNPTALEATIVARRPIILEFTAQWCLNCEVLEKTTYTNATVVSAAHRAGLVPFRVDMTDFNADQKALLEKYGGSALPYALLIDTEGNVARTFSGMFSAKALTQAIFDLSAP